MTAFIHRALKKKNVFIFFFFVDFYTPFVLKYNEVFLKIIQDLEKVQNIKHINKRLNDCFDTLFANNGLQKPVIFAYDEVDSTNTEAKNFAERGERDGGAAIFFTRTQRAGRGTRMRMFESPLGGLYMSLLAYVSEAASCAVRLTMLAAVSVCRALRKIGGDTIGAKIKWVNDITVNDRKLAGILTEASLDARGMTKYVIIGIGLNLKDAPHSDEVRSIMTTLEECGVNISAEELCAAITAELLGALNQSANEIINEYRALSSIIGRRVYVNSSDGIYEAKVLDIADDGALICINSSGERVSLISADVSVRPYK